MQTLLKIRNEAQKMNGYKAGQSAAEFRQSNPEGATMLAGLIKANMPALVKEISGAMAK